MAGNSFYFQNERTKNELIWLENWLTKCHLLVFLHCSSSFFHFLPFKLLLIFSNFFTFFLAYSVKYIIHFKFNWNFISKKNHFFPCPFRSTDLKGSFLKLIDPVIFASIRVISERWNTFSYSLNAQCDYTCVNSHQKWVFRD